jgi:hypothetical protein
MRTAELIRGDSEDCGTFGKFKTDLGLELISLELPDRNNKHMISRILPGIYKCVLTFMPMFNQMMYILQDVEGRTEIFIHPLNWAGDVEKGYQTDSHGCIGLGLRIGELSTREGKLQKAILDSRSAINKLIADMKGESFMLTIR